MIDIFNEVYTNIKTELKNVNVVRQYPLTKTKFPCVVVTDTSNIVVEETVDTQGVHHSLCSIEINIFSNRSTKYNDVTDIKNKIDTLLSGTYHFNRISCGEVPNYSDLNILRYVLRYDFIVGDDGNIYR